MFNQEGSTVSGGSNYYDVLGNTNNMSELLALKSMLGKIPNLIAGH